MADKLHELTEHIAALLKTTGPILPRQFYYPGYLVKEAAELYKDQDGYINGHDGSQYFLGVQTRHCTHLDTSRLNARIATMDLPEVVRQVYPKQNNLYLLDLLYRYRYMVYVGRRGIGKSFLDCFMTFREPLTFERRYLGQVYYRSEKGE